MLLLFKNGRRSQAKRWPFPNDQPLPTNCMSQLQKRCSQIKTSGTAGSASAWNKRTDFCMGKGHGLHRSMARGMDISIQIYVQLFRPKFVQPM